MMQKHIRVVIPCCKADGTIKTCLESVFLSENIDMEVVIVDDGDNLSLSGLARIFPIVLVATSGRQGAGLARNYGASGFKGKVLIFIDADVKVEKHALSHLVTPILSGNADATVGRYSGVISRKNLSETYKNLYLAYTYSRPKKELKNTFWTALSAVRMEHFSRANGFDTNFRGAGPEDIDLGIKLSGLNANILSVPEAVGEHLASRNIAGLIINDLRKGCEDVYIHWKKGVSITDNRHAGISSIASVLLAWSILILPLLPLIQKYYFMIIISCLYLCFRMDLLIKGYFRTGLKIFLAAIPITYVLDLIRGTAVILGSIFAAIDGITKGRWKPFNRVG